MTRHRAMARPLVEVLYFEGCPNHEGARGLVERVSRELGIESELRLVEVASDEEAWRLRFLGSPTIRVEGDDVDPRANARRSPNAARRLRSLRLIAQQQSQLSPRQLPTPSLAARAAIASAAAGSAHHQPASAFNSSPISSATER